MPQSPREPQPGVTTPLPQASTSQLGVRNPDPGYSSCDCHCGHDGLYVYVRAYLMFDYGPLKHILQWFWPIGTPQCHHITKSVSVLFPDVVASWLEQLPSPLSSATLGLQPGNGASDSRKIIGALVRIIEPDCARWRTPW